MNRNNAPIIFVHYGDSPYLKQTLEAARRSNPNKDVVLLGDAANKKYSVRGIHFRPFEELPCSAEREEFRRVYRFVAGERHGKEHWTRFVFERWFYIYEFLRSEGFSASWSFDSDTFLLTDLVRFENFLSQFDCTEQCVGSCMGGYVRSAEIIERYLRKINVLFSRPDYLESWRKKFESMPDYAFTEMIAYEVFKQEDRIKTFHLGVEREGEIFDDCICHSHEMEMLAPNLKKIFVRSDGALFFRHLPSARYLRVNSLNMSWVPLYLFRRVFAAVRPQFGRPNHEPYHATDVLKVLPVEEDFLSVVRRRSHSAFTRVKRQLSRASS